MGNIARFNFIANVNYSEARINAQNFGLHSSHIMVAFSAVGKEGNDGHVRT